MNKILSFIIKNDKLLLLKGSDNDPQFHTSFWYVVTGGVEEEDNDLYDTVRREIKEETNLDVNRIINLNQILEYDSLGEHCTEHTFISYVDDNKIILNEENIEYKWCDLDEFIELIRWYYDKTDLKTMLKNYINNK